jgi:hypothetical protein
MPAERVLMKKIRDVLRLMFELRMGRRKVSEATGVGRTAVTDYVQHTLVRDVGAAKRTRTSTGCPATTSR